MRPIVRLWSLHPRYLDARGLVALWREALLAQAVLCEKTVGYRHHPQLTRFRDCGAARAAVAAYLRAVVAEAERRGYAFDARKIGRGGRVPRLSVSRGQLDYEWRHLKRKLKVRDPKRWRESRKLSRPQPHPLFRVVAGGIAGWEVPARGKT